MISFGNRNIYIESNIVINIVADKTILVKNTAIYLEIKKRDMRNLFAAVLFFLIALAITYLIFIGITEMNIIEIIIIPIMALVFIWKGIKYLHFYISTKDNIQKHPDFAKFFRFKNPGNLLNLFETELNNEKGTKFSHCRITKHFIIAPSFFRYSWTTFSEIITAKIIRMHTKLYGIIPFGTSRDVVIFLKNSKKNLVINVQNDKEGYEILKIIFKNAPNELNNKKLKEVNKLMKKGIEQENAELI
ncbi:Uncharacterised protein [Candidatus Tiddalikarchaeum anstoanum]|nr:Uncharacterised protein [Candidatus Tiddalikarchaeum anstoanum]